MKEGEHYYTAPLAALRTGGNPLEGLTATLACGIVNAGLGYRKAHGEAGFEELLDQAHIHARTQRQPTQCPPQADPALWEATLAGAWLLGIRGGDRAANLRIHQQHVQHRQVFFRIRADWFWNAMHHARNLAGDDSVPYEKPLTWREFRILAALLSARVNRHGFTFLGWESIQARACGYPSKAEFRAALEAGTPGPTGARTLLSASGGTAQGAPTLPSAPGGTVQGARTLLSASGSAAQGARTLLSASGSTALPAHCQPLTRDMIRHDLDRLEALGFFARVRYSRGVRGGFTAYSFRHPQRQDLITAVQAWAAANASFKAKAATHRQEDLAAFRGIKTARLPESQAWAK